MNLQCLIKPLQIIWFLVLAGVLSCNNSTKNTFLDNEVLISDSIFEGAAHYVIKTLSATWYYDIKGGGFSRLIDRDGNDWISFKKDSIVGYPASAAGFYRGMPNFVHGSENSGVGHPGFNKCNSYIAGRNKVITRSNDGKWQWIWAFYENCALVEMKETDPEYRYWFLYEGIPGGKWDVENSYWGTEKGPRFEKPDFIMALLYLKTGTGYFLETPASTGFYLSSIPNQIIYPILSVILVIPALVLVHPTEWWFSVSDVVPKPIL